MSEIRVASRYAESLLALASEQGVLDQVEKDMNYLLEVCNASHEFVTVMGNPIIPHSKKKQILEALFADKVNALTLKLFVLLTQKNREAYLKAIANEYKSLYRLKKGIELAEVTTVYPLQDDQRNLFKNMVAKQSGKQVELHEKVDANILGGYILKIADKMVDESVQSKLVRLKNKLNDNSYISKY
jgi:F-type H+-transporting ATPase subunit delta